MAIVHIVLFSFKPLATAEEIDRACKQMLALKDTCVHPTTNKPYIKSGIGGSDNSPEGLQNGISHAFISEFESEEDRKYYLEKDPDHKAFVQSLSGIADKVQVIDFTPGVFS